MANNSSRQFLLRLVCALFVAYGSQWVHAQVQPIEATKLQNLAEAIQETESMLEKYPDSDFTPNLMFQLAELYVHRAKLRFQTQMADYELAEKEFEQGVRTEQPTLPKVDYGEAFEITYRLLKKYPQVHFLNELFYKMAVYHMDVGDYDKAIEYFVHLAESAEDKALKEEAHFRVGEYFFEQQDYASAIDYYKLLLNSWDSPYFDMALYKLGWCYYNVEEYAEAISTFIYLIEDIHLLEEVELEYLGKTKADLRTEAKEYIASCFAEFGGPEKARSFFSDRKKQAYSEPVLLHLAELYKNRNFYTEAIETLTILAEFYPDTTSAPSYFQKIVENYELAGERQEASQVRSTYIDQFGQGSPWLEKLTDQNVRKDVLATSETYLYTLATDAQARAQAEKSQEYYSQAISHYQRLIDKFPQSETLDKVWFYLGECLFDVGRYAEAADSYYQLQQGYTNSELLETASYNRILAYNKLLASSTQIDSTELYLNNFLGQDPARSDTIKVARSAQAYFMKASNDFVLYLRESSKLPEVVMKLAENLYILEQFALAKEAYQSVLDHPATNGSLPQAYTMIAQCEFKQGNYDQAEQWFQKLISLNPDSSRYVVKANKMISSAKFKVAENFLASGDTLQAAAEFEKIFVTVSEREVAEKALLEGAGLYENLNDKARAAGLYESLASRFPDSKVLDKTMFKAALLREELGQWTPAAKNFLVVFDHDPSGQFASKSLFFAARNYESANEYKHAREYFERYSKLYRDDPDRLLEAVFKKGEIAYNQRDYVTALKDFNSVIENFNQLRIQQVPLDNYFPANAQFLIGEILYDDFKQIKLSQPLEKNLKRKQAKFQEVVKAYTEAAKYKLAEWATASSYKIGVTFEEFGQALLDSPRPADLTEQDLMSYNQKLWQSVLPFKEKAFQTYQANVRQAEQNNIDNKWVVESKKRLTTLAAELGLDPFGASEQEPNRATN